MTILVIFVAYALLLSAALAAAGHSSRSSLPNTTGIPRRPPARILIVGATGGTGRQLVLRALERGLKVTALVRDPSKLEVKHPDLTIVRGDVLDYASVEAAVRSQDAVVSALGHRQFFYPTRILSQGTANIVKAMEAHGVTRIVCETSLGIGDSAGRMGLYYTLFTIPLILPFYFWDKARQERIIAESHAEWVIVRPGVLTNGPGRKRTRHGRGIGNFLWTVRIPRADVADFMLNQLASNEYLRAAPGVC